MKISLLVIAAGEGKRFGGHKLITKINGEFLFKRVLSKFININFYKACIVSCEARIKKYAEENGWIYIQNNKQYLGQSYSIKLGVEILKDSDAIMICVCDQPNLSYDTVINMIKSYNDKSKIMCIRCDNKKGNPNIFGNCFFNDLINLSGDIGGKVIINKYPESIEYFDIDNIKELYDIDSKDDLKNM